LEAYSIELKRRSNLDDFHGEYLSQATINGRIIPISRWLHYAAEKGLSLPATIFQYLKPKKPPLSTKMKGITAAEYQQILAQLGTSLDGDRRGGNTQDLVSQRDRAILRLLWDLGLRRCEITRLNVGDFDATTGILRVKGKGKGAKIDLHLAPSTVNAIAVYLDRRQERLDPQMAMFVPLDFHSRQRQGESRLTGQAIADILQKYANLAGIDRPLSPHRIRHSVITELIDTHGATLQDIKSFSRHESIDTLKHYFDRSQEKQLAATIIAASTIGPD
jgi:integrase/recombinase XerC